MWAKTAVCPARSSPTAARLARGFHRRGKRPFVMTIKLSLPQKGGVKRGWKCVGVMCSSCVYVGAGWRSIAIWFQFRAFSPCTLNIAFIRARYMKYRARRAGIKTFLRGVYLSRPSRPYDSVVSANTDCANSRIAVMSSASISCVCQ